MFTCCVEQGTELQHTWRDWSLAKNTSHTEICGSEKYLSVGWEETEGFFI